MIDVGSSVSRRSLMTGLLGAGVMSAFPALGNSRASRITLLLDEPIGTISPDLYGYLLENLGTVIYDGVWVGEKSKIPNIGGIRKALIDHLKAIKASVIRWPGGNFADYYDWRDGIGPRNSRPRRTNAWSDEMPKEAPAGPQRYDPNHFGTHEFMALCRLSGGRPFLNLNLRAMNPMEGAQWVDYCNAPEGSTTLADLRKKNGSAAPFNVDYWGIGNEPWAWGGNMSAKDYAGFYRRFVQGLPRHGRELKFVACGGPPSLTNADWVRTFLQDCQSMWYSTPIRAVSVHYYTTNPGNYMYPGETLNEFFTGKDDRSRAGFHPLNYDAGGWYSLLADSMKIDGLIRANWQAVREYDEARAIKLTVDEWGAILEFGTELSPAGIRSRAVPLRDAISAALTLDILQSHADKIMQAGFTGLINQEGGIFRAEGEKFVATPIYHVFKMYADHQGGQAVRTVIEAPQISASHDGRPVSLAGLDGSASRTGNVITLTVVNPHVSEVHEAQIDLRNARVKSGRAVVLTHEDMKAQNTFDEPLRVRPVEQALKVSGSSFIGQFPPKSVTKLTLELQT